MFTNEEIEYWKQGAMRNRGNTETRRRQFLRITACGVIGALAGSASPVDANELTVATELEENLLLPHRIQKLSLRTSVSLSTMSAFYRDVLEMNVHLNETKLVVDAGKTQITFTRAENGTQPFYHFAFNIPENKILSARKWLGDRTKLAITPAETRDKAYPNDVMPFNFWNSHSIFFWDPAGNILELICRHDLKNGTKGDFRSDEILYASEIGMVTENVNQLAESIRSTFQLSQYRGGGSNFRAIGDETGLLILFKLGGVPVGAQKGQTWQIHPTEVGIRANLKLKSPTDPHSITAD